MQTEINDALQMLKDMDETELDNILHETRRVRFVSYLHNLPTPIRLALIQIPIGSMIFFSFPAPSWAVCLCSCRACLRSADALQLREPNAWVVE